MKKYPQDLRYTKTHEWARLEKNNIITVGITDHAQYQLGDLVYVELPKVDHNVHVGEEVAVVESVKTAADIYSPVSGKIVEVNEMLNSAPDKVNQDPYGNGWIYRVKVSHLKEFEMLLDATNYQQSIIEE